MGSKYGTITICKWALMMFLITRRVVSFCFAFKVVSEFEEFSIHFACDLTEQLD